MSSQIPDLLTRGTVADLLGLPLHRLTWWVWVLRPERRYRQFEIERVGGQEPRLINAPIKPIKDIQRHLANLLMESYVPPPQVHGFVRGRSPKSNAQAHPGQMWVLRADIANFFGAINFGRVRGLFMAHPFEYSADVATLLAQICCHENELPQGAPTSPVVSNFICRGLDKQLARLAANEHCYFTRYADDMCFSTDRREFPRGLASTREGRVVAGEKFERIINEHGFHLNEDKTRLSHRSQRQRITGLVVNHRVTVSRDYVRGLRNLLYIWNRYGKVAAQEALARNERRPNWPPEKAAPQFHLVVRGRVQHVGHIRGWDDPVYRSLARALARADKTFRPHPLPTTSKKRVRLYTEGPSDLVHMSQALADFHARGEFGDLEFVIDRKSSADGDAELLAQCRSWSRLAASRRPLHLLVRCGQREGAETGGGRGRMEGLGQWSHRSGYSPAAVPRGGATLYRATVPRRRTTGAGTGGSACVLAFGIQR